MHNYPANGEKSGSLRGCHYRDSAAIKLRCRGKAAPHSLRTRRACCQKIKRAKKRRQGWKKRYSIQAGEMMRRVLCHLIDCLICAAIFGALWLVGLLGDIRDVVGQTR